MQRKFCEKSSSICELHRWMIGIGIVVSMLLLSVGFVMGKYIHETYNKELVEPKRFIFVTDYEDGKTYHLLPDGETASVAIKLSNHEVGLTSGADIHYEVSVKDQDNNDISYSTNNTSQTLRCDIEQTDTIQLSRLRPGDTYTVTIQSATPFQKTITIIFQVIPAASNESYYSITSHNGWIQLDIFVGNMAAEITVKYAGLDPDNTNEMMRNWLSTVGIGTLTGLNPNSQYTFIFFGTHASVEKTEITGIIDISTNTD